MHGSHLPGKTGAIDDLNKFIRQGSIRKGAGRTVMYLLNKAK